MVIYLKHPKHGRKVASLLMEAEADEANGWVRYDPYEQAEPAPAPVPVVAVEDEPRPEYELAPSPPPERRRPGRPRKTH